MKLISLMAAALVALSVPASAQDAWKPSRNVEFVVGNAAGGTIDRIARALQHAIQSEKMMDNSITVVNKPGSGQMVGVAYMNSHAGDSHYIGVMNRTWISSQVSKNSPDYETVSPIAMLFSAYQVYAVKADSPIKDAQDLVARLRTDVSSVSFSFVARGGNEHVSAVQLATLAGGDPKLLKIAVFDSVSKAALAVAGGHVDLTIGSVGTILPMVQAGQLRILGVAAPTRLDGELASAPTFKEQGIDLISQQGYFIVGPKDLSADQVAYWEGVLEKAVQSAPLQELAKGDALSTTFAKHDQLGPWMAQQYKEVQQAQQTAGFGE